MGFVDKTPEGRYRANFRDPTGKQRSKTFRIKKTLRRSSPRWETSKSRGTYVSPNAGRMLFGEHARRWMETRNTEAVTTARDRSIIATHVLPRWAEVPLGKIDDIGLQEWATESGRRRSRATVSKALQLTAAVLRSAVPNRLIPFNPAEEVRVPGARQLDTGERIISRADLLTQLLPALPERHRAIVAVGAGAGLRWGEAIGLREDALELDLCDSP